jgi:trk system potassium uptake protein TrkH
VTGFSLYPIAEYYEMSGQWVILLLIQAGGLGIMTFGAFLALIARRRFQLREEIFLQGVFETESVGTVRRELRKVLIVTFTVEAAGAFLLWLSFSGETPRPLFNAVFHAVSAFCNAGFSPLPTNLEMYVGHLPINLTVAALIILGGLGFPVLNNLAAYPLFRKRRGAWRLTFHSRLVLSISAALLAVGTVGIFAFEYTGTLAPLPWHQKWTAAFFQSVTVRTAGFNTMNIPALSDGTLFFMMMLMWIGGSPASTAGGVKTTTFGVMLATLRALLRGREEVELFHRRLAPSAIRKALSVAFTSSALQAILLLCLLLLEGKRFQSLMFEIVSAFNTVGLSTGITAQLSPAGKLILVTAMFIGRIGPLTVAFSLAQRISRGKYSYPEERVIVG